MNTTQQKLLYLFSYVANGVGFDLFETFLFIYRAEIAVSVCRARMCVCVMMMEDEPSLLLQLEFILSSVVFFLCRFLFTFSRSFVNVLRPLHA